MAVVLVPQQKERQLKTRTILMPPLQLSGRRRRRDHLPPPPLPLACGGVPLARLLNEAGAQRLARVAKQASGQKLVQAVKAVEGKKA